MIALMWFNNDSSNVIQAHAHPSPVFNQAQYGHAIGKLVYESAMCIYCSRVSTIAGVQKHEECEKQVRYYGVIKVRRKEDVNRGK
jgi:hypothetical protein